MNLQETTWDVSVSAGSGGGLHLSVQFGGRRIDLGLTPREAEELARELRKAAITVIGARARAELESRSGEVAG